MSGVCVLPPTCVMDSECATDEVCDNGMCVPG
jgi:hypothetical protein